MSHPATKGFSVIELIVAMSVFVTITAVLLVNYNSINKRLTLDTLVHQMAQWVRETQVSAMGVKSHSGSFYHGFGLHFAQSSPGEFSFFADLTGGTMKRYDPPGMLPCGDPTVECIEIVTLQRGNSIEKICGFVPLPAVPTFQGSCPASYDQLDEVDVVFTRPNPDAEITGILMGAPTSYGNAIVYVRSLTGYERSMNIWTTGQITVQ